MDIGDYVTANRAILQAWGTRIAKEIQVRFGELLKVPAQVRVKDPISARVKQLKKNYDDPIRQMTDLVGSRFVVLTSVDLAPVRQFIETFDGWRAVQARDPDEERIRDPATFGYQSHHYEVRPSKTEVVAEGTLSPDMCCEVQVRTLLQHAYAELTHDSLYKPSQTVPSHAERLVARSMALMETTDDLLCNAINAVRIANEPAHALQEKAHELVASLGQPRAPQSIFDLIAESFRDEIKATSTRSLQEFNSNNGFVLQKIRERLGRPGLFSFPDAALVTYWLAESTEDDVLLRWPLPGTLSDVRLVLSDLGLA